MAPHLFQVLYTPAKQALDRQLQDGGWSSSELVDTNMASCLCPAGPGRQPEHLLRMGSHAFVHMPGRSINFWPASSFPRTPGIWF